MVMETGFHDGIALWLYNSMATATEGAPSEADLWFPLPASPSEGADPGTPLALAPPPLSWPRSLAPGPGCQGEQEASDQQG